MSPSMTAAPRTQPRLECGLALEFGGGRALPVVAEYLDELGASRLLYARECDLSPVAAGWGNPYGSMAEAVVAGLGLRRDAADQAADPAADAAEAAADPAADRGVDTAIIAYDGMDCGPREHLGCRLTEVIRGRPRTFAVSGQGEAGPFTAMRIAAALVSSGSAGRVLVLMLEHGQVPLDGGLPAPASDTAVGFVVGARGPLRLAGVEVRPGGREETDARQEADCPLEAAAEAPSPDAPGADALSLDALAADMPDLDAPGLAVWAELAASLSSLSQGSYFTLRRTEPDFGYRCELRVAP